MLEVRHREMAVGELAEALRQQSFPIKRSTHVGNQPAHELVLQCHLPPGLINIAVDTIRADDRYSNPRVIRLDRVDVPIATKKAASLIVGMATVREDIEDRLKKVKNLAVQPRPGDSLLDFHQDALEQLVPGNMPVLMSKYFASNPDLYRAVMESAESQGLIRRAVNSVGIIDGTSGPVEDIGIFGLNDTSSSQEGALPPLEAMMTIDILDTVNMNSEKTMHLGGPDMIRYTRDSELMGQVDTLVCKAAAELGIAVSKHCYEVVDITGLGRLVPEADYTSQHELLITRNNPEPMLERVCAGVE